MPTFVQSGIQCVSGNSTTAVVTLNGVTAGNILIAYSGNPTTGRTVSVADNVNGTYNNDQLLISSGGIYSFPNTQGGTIIITGTVSGAAAAGMTLLVEEWTGVAGTLPLDKTTSNTGSAQTTGTTGTTATLSAGNDLCCALIMTNTNAGAGLTAQAPFNTSTLCPVGSGVNFTFSAASQVQAATTGVICTFGAWTNSATYRAAIATYKAGSGTVSDTLLGQGWV